MQRIPGIPSPVPFVAEASQEGVESMAGIRIPQGWKIDLFAAEPMLPMLSHLISTILENLRCETFRQNQG